MAALRARITLCPRAMITVAVRAKLRLAKYPGICDAVKSVERRLKGEGRAVLRPSGAEPEVRVLVEGIRELRKA